MLTRTVGRLLASNARRLGSIHLLRQSRTQNAVQTSLSLLHGGRTYATARTASKPKAKAKRNVAKTKAKKKPAPKKKLVPKKKAVRKPKKPLTAEEKLLARIDVLKAKSKLPGQPKSLPNNSWTVFVTDYAKTRKDSSIKLISSEVAQEFRNLSASEKEHLSNIGRRNKTKNEEALAAWSNAIPIEDIHAANRAKKTLRSLAKKHSDNARVMRKIGRISRGVSDDRLQSLKKPPSAYMLFSQEHRAGIQGSVVEVAKALGAQWQSLTDAEKKDYFDRAASLKG